MQKNLLTWISIIVVCIIILPSLSNVTTTHYIFTTKVIDTSVDEIIPYEQTESPLTITATGPSDLNNVTLYYRNITDNTTWNPSDAGITWETADNHYDGDGTFSNINYINKAIVMNAYPYGGIKPSTCIFAYVASLRDNCLTIINATKQWQQTELAHYSIAKGPHDIQILDYPNIGRVAFVVAYSGGALYAINVTNPSGMTILDSIDNVSGYGMYMSIDEIHKILYLTEYVFSAGTDYLHAYNITNPSDIKWICKVKIPRDKPWSPHVNDNNLNYVYVSGSGGSAPYNSSVSIFNVTWARNVTSPSIFYMKTQGYGSYADLVQDGDYLYGDSAYSYLTPPVNYSLCIWNISNPTNLTTVSRTALNTYGHFCLWTSAAGHDYAFMRHYSNPGYGDYGINIIDLDNISNPVSIGYIPNDGGGHTRDLYRVHWIQVQYNNITNTDVLYAIGYMDNSWVTFNLSYNYSNGGWRQWEDASNPDTSSPWSWSFDFPNGTGYYEFYSIGQKSGSSPENPPSSKDAMAHYTNHPLQINFTYTPEHPTTDDIVLFSDKSTVLDGWIVNWSWDFGDGNSSFMKNTTHQYDHNGNFIVTLTIKDNDNTDYKMTKVIDVKKPNEFIQSFIFGRITNLNIIGAYLTFNAIKTRVIRLKPFTFTTYIDGEEFTISKEYWGFISVRYIFARCKISV